MSEITGPTVLAILGLPIGGVLDITSLEEVGSPDTRRVVASVEGKGFRPTTIGDEESDSMRSKETTAPTIFSDLPVAMLLSGPSPDQAGSQLRGMNGDRALLGLGPEAFLHAHSVSMS